MEKEDEINLGIIEVHDLGIVEGFDHNYKITIVDPCDNYVSLMKTLFDFESLKNFV